MQCVILIFFLSKETKKNKNYQSNIGHSGFVNQDV